ncbi:hypothetical protein COT77_03385 [Candidatus Berkelbacteria bacterium CG10_big_fil_rev_8_21_14_0_10_41_12]|uniref:Glycosyltransferase RgtA/B/C/D-like domain-containing protein n=1 Tax=Candidatus Berkelbacteria bacterium CG10_big_fil_rev_8_21_14_0_10_41_12 TaxID=1974513 RepID=A0A2M6WWB0_9BACT|nr:MAG: hypothetical protein COT77_03385 [Candidatus Berkelbacteria bacterium CG10_big_fil_rev_8_21_14_0_10_41_12]
MKKIYYLYIALALAIFIRLFFLFFPGHVMDINTFVHWGEIIYQKGFFSLYGVNFFQNVDYPPLVPYIVSQWIKIMPFADHAFLFKFFVLVIDLAIVWMIFRKSLANNVSLVLASVAIISLPLAIDGSLWGQVDNLAFLLLIISFGFLIEKKNYLSLLFLIVAILAKPHAMIAVPVYFLFFIKQGFKKIYLPTLCSLGFVALLILLFNYFSGGNLLDSFTKVVGRYTMLSLNAFNVWWIIYGAESWNIADTQKFGFLTYRQVSEIIFIILFIPIAIRIVKEKVISDKIFLYSALTYLMFFMFLTEMHERYLYLAVAFLTIFVLVDKKYKNIYYLLSATFIVNLILVLQNAFPQFGLDLSWETFSITGVIVGAINLILTGIIYAKVVREN